MAPRVVYPIPDLDAWSRLEYQIQILRDPSITADQRRGRAPDDFEVTHIRFEDNAADDAAWQYENMLGKGGFGLVGLWLKRDSTGTVVDTLAVKEMPMPTHDLYKLSDDGIWLPEEAIVQVDMQKTGCVPVLQSRGLSILVGPDGHHDKIRLYSEFCGNGSLFGVLRQYSIMQAQSGDTLVQIPEDYLWQLLHEFAQVMIAMESGPFDHPLAQNMADRPYILHLDVKLENILLGGPIDENIVKGYPSTKVADWGLAKMTSLSDERNSWDFRRNGTNHWHPPEQYKDNSFGDRWRPAPPWRVGHPVDSHPYTTAHSVFAFASIIFRLMVLDVELSRLDMFIRNASQAEAYCQYKDYKFIDGNNMNWNCADQHTQYSLLLKNTIADCLHLNPASRPSAAFLENLAATQLEAYAIAHPRTGPNFISGPQL